MPLWHLTIKIQTVENYRTNAISFWYTHIFPRNKLQRSKGMKNRLNRLKVLSISMHRSCMDPALNCLKKKLWSNQGNFSSDLRYNLQVIWLGMCFQIIRMGDYRPKKTDHELVISKVGWWVQRNSLYHFTVFFSMLEIFHNSCPHTWSGRFFLAAT